MLIKLSFRGNLDQVGFHILAEIKDTQQIATSWGDLPPSPELLDSLEEHWQTYRQICAPYQQFRGIQALGIDYGTYNLNCQQTSKKLRYLFNHWLQYSSFQPIDQFLRKMIPLQSDYHLVIATDDERLYKLPWHQWELQNEVKSFLITFCSLNFQGELTTTIHPDQTSNVLAILGHQTDLNLNLDQEVLQTKFTEETLKFLPEPQHHIINDQLWQKPWQIIFFAGHSETKGEEGRIYLNPQESLTIDQLQYAMEEAVNNGLQLAIFNSCDGIGLIKQLAACKIPYMIVMKDLIPDQVAHHFLTDFLNYFSQGDSFYLSIQKAQKKLQGLESIFPCASWLPLVYQNPHASPLIWQPLEQLPSKVNSFSYSVNKSLKPILFNSLLATFIIIIIRCLGLLQGIELITYDQMMKLRSPEEIDSRITVIQITEEDTNKYGYPIPDQILVNTLKQLNSYQPLAIGLDLHRYQPRGEGRKSLIELLNQPDIISVCVFGTEDKTYAPPQEVNSLQLGFSNLLIDSYPFSEDKIRRHLLSYDPNKADSLNLCTTPYSLSWRMAYFYLNHQNITPIQTNSDNNWQFGKRVFPRLSQRFGGYQNLDQNRSQIMINYRQNLFVSQRFNLSQLLDKNISPSSINNKIIFIGYTSSIARDNFKTPIGELSGIWIHAHQSSQIMSHVLENRPLIKTLSQFGDSLLILFTSIITYSSILGIKKFSPQRLILKSTGGLILESILLFLIYLSLLESGLWLPLIPCLLGNLLTLVIYHFSSYAKHYHALQVS